MTTITLTRKEWQEVEYILERAIRINAIGFVESRFGPIKTATQIATDKKFFMERKKEVEALTDKLKQQLKEQDND